MGRAGSSPVEDEDVEETSSGADTPGALIRLNGPRVEALSGAAGTSSSSSPVVPSRRSTARWSAPPAAPALPAPFDKGSGGPLSVRADGSVFALRLPPWQDGETFPRLADGGSPGRIPDR